MRNVRSVFVALLGMFGVFRLFRSQYHYYVFDAIFDSALTIIGTVFFLWSCYLDIRNYRRYKSWKELAATLIGILLLIITVCTYSYLQRADNAPSKIFCITKIVDFNGASIDFRADGTYLVTNWCLGEDYYRGHYVTHDSVIEMDKKGIGNILESSRLLVRADSALDSTGIAEKSIYQIDDSGRMVDKAIDFRVVCRPE